MAKPKQKWKFAVWFLDKALVKAMKARAKATHTSISRYVSALVAKDVGLPVDVGHETIDKPKVDKLPLLCRRCNHLRDLHSRGDHQSCAIMGCACSRFME